MAFRWYDADRVVLGKPMRDQLRMATCYWHSFAWNGSDMFGVPASIGHGYTRAEPIAAAEQKMNAAFEFMSKLTVPFWCFHDRDISPEGATFAESASNLDHMVDLAAGHQERTGIQLLWGTANLFSDQRFMTGAATNPDPDVFAFAAGQVAHCMRATQRLGGQNYVLWGGREGYETLLNTDMKREIDQLGRFMNLVVEHEYALGLRGNDPGRAEAYEPTKHQYDFDVAAVFAFLQKYGLEREIKVNIEVNHATLAGHDFAHEIELRSTPGYSDRSTPTPATIASAGTSTASRSPSNR